MPQVHPVHARWPAPFTRAGRKALVRIRPRLRLFSIAGYLATARVTTLHLAGHEPCAGLVQQALDRLHALAAMPAPA